MNVTADIGFLQRSVHRPLIFRIFVKEFEKGVIKFGDDTKLFRIVRNLSVKSGRKTPNVTDG